MLLRRDRGWIGVDVGTHAVKLAQVERRGTEYALAEAVVIQRSQPWDDAETLASTVQRSEEELIAARTLGEGFRGSAAATVLPMAVCQLKSMQVPDGTRVERRMRIAKELATSAIPGIPSREFDFWPIDNALENATVVRENVSVLSLATQWTERVTRDHQRAKLVCQAVDGVPLALGRALRLCERAERTRPVAVLDWGFTRATFCIVLDGRPLFVRCLRDCQFGAVIRMLRDSLALTWDEARRVAKDFAAGPHADTGDNDPLQSLVSEVVVTAINQLVAELERTLVYLKSHRAKLMPAQMWLFGGGAAVRGMNSLIEQRINMEVRCWDLGDDLFRSDTAGESPVAMLGPAIALSTLAWEEV